MGAKQNVEAGFEKNGNEKYAVSLCQDLDQDNWESCVEGDRGPNWWILVCCDYSSECVCLWSLLAVSCEDEAS